MSLLAEGQTARSRRELDEKCVAAAVKARGVSELTVAALGLLRTQGEQPTPCWSIEQLPEAAPARATFSQAVVRRDQAERMSSWRTRGAAQEYQSDLGFARIGGRE